MSKPNSSASVHKVEKEGPPAEVIPYGESRVMKTNNATPEEYRNNVMDPHLPSQPRQWIPGIRKDDEFFHFVILCFTIGTLLVCYHKYNDWIFSIGIGLMTFAALEITGIYFGLMQRICNILKSFMHLTPLFKIPGFKKIV
ncbi:transmembrane protein 40 [Hemicordylus capensis]|uniref:transmembrane protein 40 n=1 Tax=Hemicordylus capensis TaxID=884348 RepID=UPI0023040B04|nr:transmembrane protein 40 [Hemicordylus capensis]